MKKTKVKKGGTVVIVYPENFKKLFECLEVIGPKAKHQFHMLLANEITTYARGAADQSSEFFTELMDFLHRCTNVAIESYVSKNKGVNFADGKYIIDFYEDLTGDAQELAWYAARQAYARIYRNKAFTFESGQKPNK